MHIVLYHDALIPPPKYGGTERVIAWLSRALVTLGHRVSLIAHPGSSIPGVETIPYRLDPHLSWETRIPGDADILHLWNTPRPLPKLPYVVTIGGHGQFGELFAPNTVFVSRKHAEIHGSPHFVHNGIDPDDYFCDEKREDYAVFLAKASWKVKNLKGAISVARKAGIELRVMGSRDLPFHLNRVFAPKWRGVRYLGMLGDLEKREVLRKAKALIFPVRWHEPFGLAITESLASGCPVFGTPYGSIPEIITRQTGVLSDRAQELADALRGQTFSPSQCRKRVFEGFTHLQMAQNYVRLYEQVLNRGQLVPSVEKVTYREKLPAQSLLGWDTR